MFLTIITNCLFHEIFYFISDFSDLKILYNTYYFNSFLTETFYFRRLMYTIITLITIFQTFLMKIDQIFKTCKTVM